MRKALLLIFAFLFANSVFGAMGKSEMKIYSERTGGSCICKFIEAGYKTRCEPSVGEGKLPCIRYCRSKLNYGIKHNFRPYDLCQMPFDIWSNGRNWDDLP